MGNFPWWPDHWGLELDPPSGDLRNDLETFQVVFDLRGMSGECVPEACLKNLQEKTCLKNLQIFLLVPIPYLQHRLVFGVSQYNRYGENDRKIVLSDFQRNGYPRAKRKTFYEQSRKKLEQIAKLTRNGELTFLQTLNFLQLQR